MRRIIFIFIFTFSANFKASFAADAIPAASAYSCPMTLTEVDKIMKKEGVVIASPQMKAIVKKILRLADLDVDILITGESGTGKEVIAKLIKELGQRNRQPFVIINAANLKGDTAQTQLFGNKRGAFTGANENNVGLFEAANNGTLFIDEVEALDLGTQALLLRVLNDEPRFRKILPLGMTQEKPINVRVIAATNVNLLKLVREGKFRTDLYYRLVGGEEISLPSLKERVVDLVPLANYFMEYYSKAYKRNFKQLSPEIIIFLHNSSWPGNVRQLATYIKRAVLAGEPNESVLKAVDTETIIQSSTDTLHWPNGLEINLTDIPLGGVLVNAEKDFILGVLKLVNYDKQKAAKILGISSKTFYNRYNSYMGGDAKTHNETQQ